MVSTIDEARTPAELAEWLRVWADGYEEGVDYLDDNDARQLAVAVERVCQIGNAAALREALEWVAAFSSDDYVDDEYSVDGENLQRAAERARAALAAPARNCDRFTNWHDAMRDEYFTRSTPGNVKGYPYGDDKRWREFCDWLFATAEGGDHA